MAPLKLLYKGKPPANLNDFPRLNSRGPIEAVCVWDVSHGHFRAFPRLNSRGPIEAVCVWDVSHGHFRAFPRLNSRGPIEARGSVRPPTLTPLRTFHG